MELIAAHKWKRETNEHYVEPFWCSERLFAEEKFEGFIRDPCCGFGRISDSARAAGLMTYASDIVDRGYRHIDQVQDFFSVTEEDVSAPNIVCNPPFNIAERFALHALNFQSVRKVAMIFPTARLNAAHWLRGTPLACIWLMTPRSSMPPGHTITAGLKPGGGKIDFCWLVWDRHHGGSPLMKWLHRNGNKVKL